MDDLYEAGPYQIGGAAGLRKSRRTQGHPCQAARGARQSVPQADDDIAMAIGRAIKGVDAALVYMVMPTQATRAPRREKLGLAMCARGLRGPHL